MLKSIASLDQKIADWESKWILANDCPLSVCKEFHFQHGKYLAAIEDRANELEAQKKKETEVQESPVTDICAEPIEITPAEEFNSRTPAESIRTVSEEFNVISPVPVDARAIEPVPEVIVTAVAPVALPIRTV